MQPIAIGVSIFASHTSARFVTTLYGVLLLAALAANEAERAGSGITAIETLPATTASLRLSGEFIAVPFISVTTSASMSYSSRSAFITLKGVPWARV